MIISESSKSESTGKFLSNPSSDSENHISRVECSYTNNSERFLVKNRDFSRQYAHLYAERLLSMRVKLVTAAKKKWGNAITIRKLHELQSNEKCVVVGTLFKHMELKPSILKEISDEHNVPPQPIQSKYIQDDDKLILEDELQRIILLGELAVQTSITGVVVAVLGMEPEDDKGKFHVEDYCFQELPEQVPRPQLTEDRYVLLVSGLELGGGGGEHMLELQLLVDLVGGQLGDPGQQSSAATIARVILAGNALARSTQDRDCLSKAKYLTKKTAAGTVEAVKSLDDILVQLAGSVDVDVMPGEFDPGNFTLPQQPLHRCMFPQAMRFPTTHCVTNPYHCTLDGVSILGTSGQPVEDVFRYSALDDRLDILEKLLEWGHLAPTAPDTLACYPYYEQDPFILNECPHIYFAGNQDSFQSKIYKGPAGQEVLLVVVPKFCQTRTAVLVNLRSLDCQPVSFETSFPAGPSSNSPEVDK